jgi:hypothetical protein
MAIFAESQQIRHQSLSYRSFSSLKFDKILTTKNMQQKQTTFLLVTVEEPVR